MKKIKWKALLMGVVGTLTGLGIGGLFINKTFESTIILEHLPDIIHQVVGYSIIGLTIIYVLIALYGYFMKKR